MPLNRRSIVPTSLLLAAILSLGCLIPAPDDGPDAEDNNSWYPDDNNDYNNPYNNAYNNLPNTNNDPNNDPGRPTNPERDDPSSPNYRGNFEAIMSGDRALTLDADGLGEATVSLVPAMAGFNEAHCLISLIDREPDAQGHSGYILFHYPGERCPGPGTYAIINDDEDVDGQGITFKSFQLEQESADAITYSSYSRASGVFTVTSNDGAILKGELDLKLGMISVDDAPPRGSSVELRVAFDAPYLEL